MRCNYCKSSFYLTIVLLIIVIMQGCSNLNDIEESLIISEQVSTKTIRGKQNNNQDLSKAVYHLSTGTWIIPQQDPYDWKRMCQACEIVGAAPEEVLIKATHNAIKFFPKDENEQWRIEKTDGVSVDYTPFNYEQVSREINKELGPEPKDLGLVLDDCRYIVSYPNINEDGISMPESYRMPVLYTVWPIDKPLPDDIEYEMDHAVFIPNYRQSEKDEVASEILKSVEREAIRLALGYYPKEFNSAKSNDVITLQGYVFHYDSVLDSAIGLQNLKIRFQLGSNMWDTYVQQSGLFSITEAISTAASYKHIFQHPKWKITNNNSTNPLVDNWGQVSDYWSNVNDIPSMCPVSSTVDYDVLSAVNYYYTGSHPIRTWSYDAGIRIIVPGVNGSNVSEFYPSASPTYIKVYENYHGSSGPLMGAILHELGHFTMYCECGGYDDYMNNYYGIERLLRESYASYVGWYLTKTRYANLGYTEAPSLYDFTGQTRQGWIHTHCSQSTYGIYIYYSPVFVDLVDTYNQYDEGPSYNNDVISIPYNVHLRIREMAAQCKTWDDIKDYLDDYVGVYYTQSQFSIFCTPYNYWYEHI